MYLKTERKLQRNKVADATLFFCVSIPDYILFLDTLLMMRGDNIMQIGKITINNFKGIDNKEFTPDKINLFIGKNGAGKTSYMEAVRYALTGEAPENILRTGKTLGSVKTTVFGGTEIERFFGKKSNVRVAGVASTQKSLKQFLEENGGIQMDTMKMITLGKLLTSMTSGELSNFLVSSKLIPIEIDMEKFLSLCPLSSEAQEELSIMLPEAPVKFNMEAITDAYNYFYSCRADKKKAVDVALKKSVFEGTKPAMSLSAVDKTIADINASNKEKEIHDKLVAAYEKAVADRTRKLQELKRLEDSVKSVASAKKPDELIKTSAEQQVRNCDKAILAQQTTLNVLGSNVAMFEKTLANLDTSVCPLSNKLVCSTDKTAVKEEILQVIADNKKQMLSLTNEIADLKSKKNAANEAIQKYNADLEKFRNAQAIYDKYRFFKDNIPEIPEKPEERPSLEENRERLDELKKVREQIICFELAEKSKQEYTELSKELGIYEELVKNLNPKGGILERIIEFAFKPLIEHCNNRAKTLKADFEIAVKVDNGIRFLCKSKSDSGYLSLESVSSGEQLLAIFLIVDMLNTLSGFNILMLDDLDKLDEAALEGLMKLILNPEVLDTYDHIFLATVNHPDAINTFKKYDSRIQTICL